MKKVRVLLGERSYNILIGRGLLKSCGPLILRAHAGRDAVVITNRKLLKLYGKVIERSLNASGISARFETVPDSEKAKSAKIATALVRKISSYDKRRSLFIIAFGGGVIGDLAGFVASVYRRGIPYIQIPTTLLAQVDSAIGGKVAIDLPVAKNLMGSFYQPMMVISDTSLLDSLTRRQMINGLAEIIKYGIIKDRKLFAFLEKNYKKVLSRNASALEYVIMRSSAIKAFLVSGDEFDRKGLRALLNLGHTIGHAIESASKYSSRYGHGEAIAIGIIASTKISLLLDMIDRDAALRITGLIEKVGLPAAARGILFSDVYESHLHDKKFSGRINRFVLPTAIGGACVYENVPDDIIRRVLKETL